MKNILAGAIFPHPPIIVDEVGGIRGNEAKATKKACAEIGRRIQALSPDTIVIISPHGPAFRDAIAMNGTEILSGSFKNFGVSNVQRTYDNDLEFVHKLHRQALKEKISTIVLDKEEFRRYGLTDELDHGVLVPMYFTPVSCRLVSITYGLLSREELFHFGKIIAKVSKELDRKVVIIASGDLSHALKSEGPYEYHPMGPLFDEKIVDYVKNWDVEKIMNMKEEITEPAAQCGLRSFLILLGALDQKTVSSEVLSYEGPFGVGYMCAYLKVVDPKEKMEDPYVLLARESIEYYFKNHQKMDLPKGLKGELTEQKACFVTLHKEEQLRGCIGTILPVRENLAAEIISNALSAAFDDPRFLPLQEKELQEIKISVDVLTKPTPISSTDQLDPKKYGVIVTANGRRGLLLPDLDGVDTVSKQLSIACQKAGIPNDMPYGIEIFEVIRHA